MTSNPINHKGNNLVVLLPALLVFCIILVRTAWVSDDSYITFRTVDNLIHGYGLTWNVVERVQTYTNPLWMFLVTGFYYFTHEIYFTVILLSIVITLLTLSIYVFYLAGSNKAALWGLTALAFSKAFVDFSTSGLENALTHLLLVIFLLVYSLRQTDRKRTGSLYFISALVVLNRMDIGLILVPPLLSEMINRRSLKVVQSALVGFSPFILWVVFSIIYYGFPFPNTALAKLHNGIPPYELAGQGLIFLFDSLLSDPVTLPIILISICYAFVKRRDETIASGMLLYLVYIIRVGGDFMGGRLLTPLILCGVVLLTRPPLKSSGTGTVLMKITHQPIINRVGKTWHTWTEYQPQLPLILALLLVICAGFTAPHPSVIAGANYRSNEQWGDFINSDGIADERGFYYQGTGLLNVIYRHATSVIDYPWSIRGLSLQQTHTQVAILSSIGFSGYYAGPGVYLVDINGLSDAFLARLYPNPTPDWRIGHFARAIPCGYIETLKIGSNLIVEPDLGIYFDHLQTVIRGPLFTRQRLLEIWNFDTGKYNHLLEAHNPANGCDYSIVQ